MAASAAAFTAAASTPRAPMPASDPLLKACCRLSRSGGGAAPSAARGRSRSRMSSARTSAAWGVCVGGCRQHATECGLSVGGWQLVHSQPLTVEPSVQCWRACVHRWLLHLHAHAINPSLPLHPNQTSPRRWAPPRAAASAGRCTGLSATPAARQWLRHACRGVQAPPPRPPPRRLPAATTAALTAAPGTCNAAVNGDA